MFGAYNPPAPVGFSYTRTLGLKDDRVFLKRGRLFFKRGHVFKKGGHLFKKGGHLFKKDGHLLSFPDFSRRFSVSLSISLDTFC